MNAAPYACASSSRRSRASKVDSAVAVVFPRLPGCKYSSRSLSMSPAGCILETGSPSIFPAAYLR